MLTELENRILRYMIAQDSDDCIPINFSDVPIRHQIEAVKELEAEGCVRSVITMSSVSAFLTESGKYYIQMENYSLYGAYSDKITQLENNIEEGRSLLESHNKNKIILFVNKILSLYREEIGSSETQNIRNRLELITDSTTFEAIENELGLLIEILKRICSNIKIEAKKQNNIAINNVNNFSPTVNSIAMQNLNIEISLSSVIEQINKTNLSNKDKDEIIRILNDINRCKPQKMSLWKKIKEALKFLLNKSIEICAIVLPFLSPILQNVVK